MWQSKKFILIAMLITAVLSWSVLGMSCSSTGGGGEQLPSAPQNTSPPAGMPPGGVPPEGVPPGPGLPKDLLARVAEILGIEQQKLADAFAQARSEMPGGPPGIPPGGMPPEGMPPGPGLPKDLLARVAEILGIDQQTLEDAFAQAQSEMPAGPPGMPPPTAPEINQ